VEERIQSNKVYFRPYITLELCDSLNIIRLRILPRFAHFNKKNDHFVYI
jgi:hypothetical protein